MTEIGSLMAGKKGLVMGVANDRSLAWNIAKKAGEQGAEMAFTYQSESLLKRVKPLVESIGSSLTLACDVQDDDNLDAVFDQVGSAFGKLDFLIHGIAYSDKDQLKGRYAETTRDNFLATMDVSVYSFTACARRAAPLMTDGGAMVTLTYLGAERVMPNYNVMGVAKAALEASVRYLAEDFGKDGIRVNGLSAGPIKTLAAAGIGDFRYILKWNQYNSPLRRTITPDDVAGAGLYLISDLSSGVTGETHHVDSGYHIVGMKAADAPDIDAT